jgi:hypothetical protein
MPIIDIEYSKITQKSILKIFDKYCEELEDFWKIKIKTKPILFLLKSRKEIDIVRDQKTDDRLVGWFWREKFLFILDPDKFETESIFQKKDFNSILKHELSHYFYLQATNGTLPAWLDEGLACYIAGQKYKEAIDKDIVGKLIRCHYQFDRSLFAHSFLLVEKLIDLKGENNLLIFLKSFKKNINENEFRVLFQKFFQIDFNKNSIYELLTK